MATLKTPGVYVQEITKFPPSVAPVATAIPAFIGYTEKATELQDGDLNLVPKRITSMLEYEEYFGFAELEQNITAQVTNNNNIIVDNPSPSIYKMYYSMQMYFANGGGPCYVTSIGDYSSGIVAKANIDDGLAEIRKVDEPTLLLFPDATSMTDVDEFHAVLNDALAQCFDLQDRFTIMDTYRSDDIDANLTEFRTKIRSEKDYVKYGAAYYPYLDTILDYNYQDSDVLVTPSAISDQLDEQVESIRASISTTGLNTDIGDITTLLSDITATSPGDNAAALAFKGDVTTATNKILNYYKGLKTKLETIYDIGRQVTDDDPETTTTSDSIISGTNDVDTWITDNVNNWISQLENKLDKLAVDNTRAKLLNTVTAIEGIVLSGVDTETEINTLTSTPGGLIDTLRADLATYTSAAPTPQSLEFYETADNELYNRVKAAISSTPVTLPPSSAMAGIYARVDNAFGVWKAPANVNVQYVVQPVAQITNELQEDMNVTSSGKSVNAIRTFIGKGTLAWGARTLAGNDNEWRYIPVRRLFSFVEESVSEATEQFVFEPNTANTWVRVRTLIENFLIQQWKAGALAGSTPDEAFYVRVGLGQTMTSQDVLEGRMIVEIGMAAVRPAEFIVLRFSHKMQEA